VCLSPTLARYKFKGKSIVEGIINLPVNIPHTAAGIFLIMVFGKQGLLGRFFTPLGIFFTDTLAGVIVAMIFVSLPLLVQ